ncbi:MAG: DUF4418 family protein [Clostridia bacterium]|nr:DUF4418 family protein [Clostridia bacterium]MBR1684532.1 DUF4418 family protein [Clostridia bacterium]MBR2287192.1 DUF4418 family protein [Clostridia bacterium]
MSNKRSFPVFQVIILLLSVFLTVSVRTFFGACVHDDGTFSTCHWAGEAVFGSGIVLSVLALLSCIFPQSGIRAGLALSSLVLSLGTAFIPGNLISLCMMSSMRCQSIMKPAVMVTSVLLAVFSLIAFLGAFKRLKAEV